VSGDTTLTVLPAALTSISVTPIDPIVAWRRAPPREARTGRAAS
jgi:hypothetical protein